MRNTLAFKTAVKGLLVLWIGVIAVPPSAWSGNGQELANELASALSGADGTLNENSRPLFEPQAYDAAHPKRQREDPFYAKLRKKRSEFNQKSLERRQKTFAKLREQDLSAEETQVKLSEFEQKERKRADKFYAKEQQKIQKHLEELKDKQNG